MVDVGDETLQMMCMWCDGESVGERTRERIQRQLEEAKL